MNHNNKNRHEHSHEIGNNNEHGEKNKYFHKDENKKCLNCEYCTSNGKKCNCECGCDSCHCNGSASEMSDECCG